MSGTIDVSSRPGEGSNFHFTIKVSKVYETDKVLKQPSWHQENEDLLRVLGEVNMLVVGKHMTTADMIRELVPGKHIDNVCSASAMTAHLEARQYDVIIMGLLLPEEFDELWLDCLATNRIHHAAIIIMHYPSGSMRKLQRSHWVESVSSLFPPNKVVRLAVPLRRLKLLRTVADMLNRELPKPTKVKKALKGNTATEEERERFSQLHILVAEGKIEEEREGTQLSLLDNPVAQKLLYKQLIRFGFRVKCANNGLEAVEAWSAQPPGHFVMAFFDHHMPKVGDRNRRGQSNSRVSRSVMVWKPQNEYVNKSVKKSGQHLFLLWH